METGMEEELLTYEKLTLNSLSRNYQTQKKTSGWNCKLLV